MKAFIWPLMVCALAGTAAAQSRSSFVQVDAFIDVFVVETGGGLIYDVELGPDPKMVADGVSYDISDVFGFWALSNDDDLVVVHEDIGVWSAHENQAGPGGIAGWKTNPNTGLTPGESQRFTFTSLNASSVEQVGFHIRLDGTFPGWGNEETGYATVPEPGSLVALLAAAPMALLRLRRRR